MIQGRVNIRNEAIVRVILHGFNGISMEIDAIVDTGFTGSLALPLSMIDSLGLIRRAGCSAILADGTSRSFDLYSAEIEWDGSIDEILISALGEEPLAGMHLFTGYELKIEVRLGGLVQAIKLG